MKYGNLTLGQIEAVVNKLGGVKVVEQILLGPVKITITPLWRTVNGNASPRLPEKENCIVKAHSPQGDMRITTDRDHLFINNKATRYYDLNRTVKPDNVMWAVKDAMQDQAVNANLLDDLLEHPETIPESWKHRRIKKPFRIFFCGTLYDIKGYIKARYLLWNGECWETGVAGMLSDIPDDLEAVALLMP